MSPEEERVRTLLAQAIEGFDPQDNALRAFLSAYRYRSVHATTYETRPGVPGLTKALERALSLFSINEPFIPEMPLADVEPEFQNQLVAAAKNLSRIAIGQFMRDLRLDGVEVPADSATAAEVLRPAFLQYASLATSSLSPGP